MPLNIPQTNLRANYLVHKHEIDTVVAETLDSGFYILGQQVAAFEKEFSSYLGATHGIGVASGTDALQICLRACRIGPGDSVVTVSHSAVATAAAIELAGATPVLIDIDSRTFTLDPNRLEDALKTEKRTRPKAVIPVHLYGHPADMPAIIEIANHYGLYVIEDCAQSHGAALKGRKAGAWGHMAAFSFYPTKNLGAIGDAGAVITNDPALAEHTRLLREYGWRERYVSEMAGMNTRLDELQAAILRVKLRYLDMENMRRRQLADIYQKGLKETALLLPVELEGAFHIYHQYVVRCNHRDLLRSYLRNQGIATLIHYPVPIHLQPAFRRRAVVYSMNITDAIVQLILSLPMYPELTDEQAGAVGYCIAKWASQESGLNC